MQSCEIILLACKFNYWCIDPFIKLFNKHWADNITIICEQDYIPKSNNCKFVKLPKQLIINGACPPKKFSDSLIWSLRNTPNDFAIIMLADYWLYDQVNIEHLKRVLDYMIARREVLRVDIGDRLRPGPMKPIDDILIECAEKRDCFLTTSLTPGMWNKKNWLSILQNDLTAWKTETVSHEAYMRSGFHSIWCEPGPIKYCNVMRSRDTRTIVMRRGVVDEIKQYVPSTINITFED